MEIIEQVQASYPIDASRIYLTGFSMGGFGTTQYLAQFPGKFAAGVPIAGASWDSIDALRDVPLYIRHGNFDDVVSVDVSRELTRQLINAGGAPIYEEVFRGNHGTNATYGATSHAMEWMFAPNSSCRSAANRSLIRAT